MVLHPALLLTIHHPCPLCPRFTAYVGLIPSGQGATVQRHATALNRQYCSDLVLKPCQSVKLNSHSSELFSITTQISQQHRVWPSFKRRPGQAHQNGQSFDSSCESSLLTWAVLVLVQVCCSDSVTGSGEHGIGSNEMDIKSPTSTY